MQRRNFIGNITKGSIAVALKNITWVNNQNPTYHYIGQPCRNFNILATTLAIDPNSGHELMVLSNFADEELGSLVLIDTVKETGENYALPVGAGAWGLVNYKNEKIILGTCTNQAYLHVFDLKTRKWILTKDLPNEAYFWQMYLAKDGNIYGGTYPGCHLVQFNPITEELNFIAKLSNNKKDLYSKVYPYNTDKYVFAWYGFDTKGVCGYDIVNKKIVTIGNQGDTLKEINEQFICLETDDGKKSFYDTDTLAPIITGTDSLLKDLGKTDYEHPALKDGRRTGIRGQDYYLLPKGKDISKEYTKPIPVDAMPTAIFELTTDEDDNIWGACGFGLTIFKYDVNTKKHWNSPALSSTGGEVYGMVFHERKLYCTAYVGGEHFVYDPKKNWNTFDNSNPIMIKSIRPKLIRPEGRSVMGPDGRIWTGWSAAYGVYGGGLSAINPKTNEVDQWYDPIPNQQVAGITADHKYIYFTTNGGASGLSYNEDVSCYFCVWNPFSMQLEHTIKLEKGKMLNSAIIGFRSIVAFVSNNILLLYSSEKKEIIKEINLPSANCDKLIKINSSKLGLFIDNFFYQLDLRTYLLTKTLQLPGHTSTATIDRKGNIYFSIKSKLYIMSV